MWLWNALGDEAPAAACFLRFPMHSVVAATKPVFSSPSSLSLSSWSIKATSDQTCFAALLFPLAFLLYFTGQLSPGFTYSTLLVLNLRPPFICLCHAQRPQAPSPSSDPTP